MPFLQCTSCGQRLDISAELAGTVIECPTCTGDISIPAAPGSTKGNATYRGTDSDSGTAFPSAVPLLLPIQNSIPLSPPIPVSAVKKPRARKLWLVTAGTVLVLILGGYGLVSVFTGKQGQLSESDALKEEMTEARRLVQAEMQKMRAGEPLTLYFTPPAQINSYEDLYRKWVYDYTNASLKSIQAYQEVITLAEMDQLLNADRVSADEGFVDTYRKLGRAKLATQKLQREMEALSADFNTSVAKLDAPDAWKKRLLATGEIELLHQTMLTLRKTWEYEFKMLNTLSSMISLLEHKREYWLSENGLFAFVNEKDLEEFNALTAELQTYADALQKLLEKGNRHH